MATLFDLAQQYLNRALPETFKYDRTNPPTIGPRLPVQPEEPIAKILPVQSGSGSGGGGEGGSNNPYNLSTDFSQITSDRQKRLSQDPTGLNKVLDNLGLLPQTAEDIVNLGYKTPSKFGIAALLPDKYGELPRADQAFIASRMGYTGPTVFGENTSGLSKDPFGLNTRSGFGNYAERVGVEAEKALDNLNRLGDKYNATWNDELGTFVGEGATKANQMTSMIQSKRKFYTGEETARKDYQDQVQDVLDADKEFSIEGDSSNYGIDGYPKYDIKDIMGEDEEDSEIPSFIIDNNITPTGPTYGPYSPTGPIVTGPTYGPYGGGSGITSAPTAPKTLANKTLNKGFNYLDINPGGGRDDGPSAPPSKTPDYSNVTTAKGPPGQISKPSFGPGSGGLGDYQIQPSKPATKKDYGPYSGGGGGGGGQDSCFLPNTLVTMIDGSTKKIIDVDIGDEVAEGGKVFATGKFLNNELYDYKGVKVSGSHMVNEDGIWMRVRDTKHGKPLGDEEHTVYVFGSENRRILINNILFTDYFEVNEQDKLINNEEDFFDNWKLYAKQDSGNNVDIINAS